MATTKTTTAKKKGPAKKAQPEWDACAVMATPSTRRKRKGS